MQKKDRHAPFLHSFTGKEKTVAKRNNNFIMLPTVDVCFKGLMYNPKVRKGFIAALLKTDPKDVRETVLLPTALRQEYPDDKLGILDVRAMMEDGAQVNMEMQVDSFEQWDARSLFYLSKMYTEQIGKGDPYTKLKKCIHVSILNFIRFADDERCYRTIRLCDEQTGKKYTDLLELQILELMKLPRDLREDDEVIRWMRFLAGKTREEFEDMAGRSEYIEEAYRESERMSADERARLEYEARQKAIRDHEAIMSSAWNRGLQEGIQQERQSMIRSMLEGGASPEEIVRLTGVTEEEVEKARDI
ncbi:Rpn family recombination-promoting nuclease/putative transposase [Mordavella massiliensis]|uniref:Rpn family recombination-promoting nuclease/putative transposase n=1 Tax=Mordavella massiliensis TaxID=1871024 RepID=A0A938XE12_9CLOT|nr:Rpn family recombination-promoting nuclease/putative transposase [Mordavella massiliensis]MBM6949190.1 Rpn family recombination-promoting nuclease/putative transposase [Mordavella massiliensis]